VPEPKATRAAESAPSGDADFVQSLARGLAVIRAFDENRPQLTLSEVARQTGLTRAAARRFLHTLVTLGYVRSNERYFSLSPRILDLGYSYLSSLGLPEVALPHMEALVSIVRESCSVSVLDGDDVVYIARVPAKRIMSVAISVGTRFPAHSTSMGRVLLADRDPASLENYLARVRLEPQTELTVTDPAELRAILAQVREQGYALVNQELEVGLRSLAVPIRSRSGPVLASMNMSMDMSRGDVESIRAELLPRLLETARAIERDLE